jgi:hypothetical protein
MDHIMTKNTQPNQSVPDVRNDPTLDNTKLSSEPTGEAPWDELDYWRTEYPNCSYYDPNCRFEDIEPAFRAGIGVYDPTEPVSWNEREELAREQYHADHHEIDWEHAKSAARDAYSRLHSGKDERPR